MLAILSFHFLPFAPVVAYTIVFLGSSVLYLWMASAAFSIEIPHRWLLGLLAISLLVRLSFVTTQPIGSDDVYRYIWDGKVQANGMNPYSYAPNAPELTHLQSPLLPSSVNHPAMKTIYFPLSQWIFYCTYQIGGEGIWSFKLVLLLAEATTLIGIMLLTSILRLPNTYTIVYALCPLPIFQFGVDAHMDGLGFPFLVFGLLLYAKEKRVPALILLALSFTIKPIGLIFLPVLSLLEKGVWAKTRVFLIPAFVLAVQFTPYLFTSNPFEALTTFTKHWTFNSIVFETLNLYFADNQRTRLVCGALLMLALVPLWLGKKSLWDKIYYSVFFLLLFSPVVHPWYVTWMALLLPIVMRWSGIVFAATVSLTSFTILTFKNEGVWTQAPVVLALEYLPVIMLLLRELTSTRRRVTLP